MAAKRLGGETTRGGNGLGAKRPGFVGRVSTFGAGGCGFKSSGRTKSKVYKMVL